MVWLQSCKCMRLALVSAVLLLLCGLLPGVARAQLVCPDPASTMLWQVSGAALDSRGLTLNLLGSIHVGKADFYPLAPEIEARFKQADALVFEVDPQALYNPQTALMIQQRGMLPAGQTLRQIVSPATMTALQATLAELGVPEQTVSSLRPWLVSLLLSSFQVMALGYDPQYGIENYLMRQKPAAAQVLELEGINSQIAMLESLDAEVFLRYSLLDFANIGRQMSELVEAWRCGDHARLAEVLLSTTDPSGELPPEEQAAMDAVVESIFYRRNVEMADGIERFIESGEGSWFVVVGAGHLIGEGSVVDLLQQRGYSVTPVRRQPTQ